MQEIRTELKNSIIYDEKLRYCEIYKIVNIETNKIYVGKAFSHKKKKDTYIPHGKEGRLKTHIAEAISNNQNHRQSVALNDAIRKYGPSKFIVELIRVCSLIDGDKIERSEIIKQGSLYPNGYNLTTSGGSSIDYKPTDEHKNNLSDGILGHHKAKKIQRFRGYVLDKPIEDYIVPHTRFGVHVGWRVFIEDRKVDFSSSYLTIDENKKLAIDFLRELSNTTEPDQSYVPVFNSTDEGRKALSKRGVEQNYESKFKRFVGINIPTDDLDDYIRPSRKQINSVLTHYGWYVYVEKQKANFGGIHISLEESKEMALEFLRECSRRNTLLSGTP